MGNYRSRLDIIADILRVTGKGAKKTQIMYQANLSYKLLTKYLSEVLDSSLLRFERRKDCYVVTAKGDKFLGNYKEYSRRNKHLEKQLNDLHNNKKILEKLCSNG